MAYPLAFRKLVVAAYLRGEGSLLDLAEVYNLNPMTLHAWVVRARHDGDLRPRASPGRPPTLDTSALEALHALVVADNDATLPALARTLTQRTGVVVGLRTIGRALQRLDITRKKSRRTRRNAAASGSRGAAAGSAHGSRASTPRA